MMELIGLITDNHRVASIRAPLIADDHLLFGGQQVDQFTFGLVTPLQADNAESGQRQLRENLKGRKSNGDNVSIGPRRRSSRVCGLPGDQRNPVTRETPSP